MKERYLSTIYKITDQGNDTAKTSEIAEELEISNPSVTEQVKKLEEKDLICRAPYKGFTLSPMGKQKAEKIIENQKATEKFLEQTLNLEKPNRQAKEITPHLEEETLQKIKQKTD